MPGASGVLLQLEASTEEISLKGYVPAERNSKKLLKRPMVKVGPYHDTIGPHPKQEEHK